jgi:hypothetical protein
MKCQYRTADGVCGAEISVDPTSYSGYTHNGGNGWLHWASPKAYGPQDSQASFVLCELCHKTGPNNPRHFVMGGHRFVAKIQEDLK